MKALDEYFLIVVFMLLLKKVHIFANLMFNLNSLETWHAVKRIKEAPEICAFSGSV